MVFKVLITMFVASAAVHALAADPSGDTDLPIPKGETIRKGDLLISRMAVEMKDGQRSNEMEASSFEAMSSKPVLDKCRFEIVKADKKYKGDEQNFPPQALDNVQVKTDVPDFDMIAFLEQLRPSAETIFNQIVDVDELSGPVFKREDLKEKIRVAFLAAPYNQLPKSTLTSVEQSIVMHLWGYWGDVQKLKKKSLEEVRSQMGEHRKQWIAKLNDNVKDYLKTEAKNRIQALKSDQLTKTLVVLNFNFKEEKNPAQSKLECWFEGEKAKLTLQRLNAVIGPYFELVPRGRQQLEAQTEAPSHGKRRRGVAVEGQPVSSK